MTPREQAIAARNALLERLAKQTEIVEEKAKNLSLVNGKYRRLSKSPKDRDATNPDIIFDAWKAAEGCEKELVDARAMEECVRIALNNANHRLNPNAGNQK